MAIMRRMNLINVHFWTYLCAAASIPVGLAIEELTTMARLASFFIDAGCLVVSS